MEVYTGMQIIFDKYPAANPDDLTAILADVHNHIGYLPKEALQQVGIYLSLPENMVVQAAQANAEFRFLPQGRHHIKVCCGTACHVKGAHRILNNIAETLEIEPGQKTLDGCFSLEITTCQNACKLAPLVGINGEVYMDSTPESIVQVIDKLKMID